MNQSVVRMTQRRILIVEDEQDIAELVALHLDDVCDEVVIANDGHEGMRLATSQDWSLIILDLRLPGPDGLQICRSIRRERRYQPILMLTAKSAELDRVLGLETGADDYLTKPFSVLELVARVRAILRRVENMQRTTQSGMDDSSTIDAGVSIASYSTRIVPKAGDWIGTILQVDGEESISVLACESSSSPPPPQPERATASTSSEAAAATGARSMRSVIISFSLSALRGDHCRNAALSMRPGGSRQLAGAHTPRSS